MMPFVCSRCSASATLHRRLSKGRPARLRSGKLFPAIAIALLVIGVVTLVCWRWFSTGPTIATPRDPLLEALNTQPTVIDDTGIDRLEFLMNGVDAVSATPVVRHGEKAEIIATLHIVPGALREDQLRMLMLFVRYRRAGSSDPWDIRNEMVMTPNVAHAAPAQGTEPIMYPMKMEPGAYDLRFYLLVGSSVGEPYNMRYIADGRLEADG